jgi:quinol monooxygenase YgiN
MTMGIRIVTAAAALCMLSVALAQAPSQGAPAASGPKGPPPTTFVVRFKIKAGKNFEFEKAMAKIQAALASSEPGNIYYDLYLPAVDSQTYVLIEHYKNADAVTAHGKDPNTRQMFTDIKDLLDGPTTESISAERLILVSSKP